MILRPTVTGEIPSNLQQRVDYDASSNAIYVGYAVRGTLASEARWLIQAFTYDVSNRPTLRQISLNAVWDNRATEDYA